MADNLVQIVLRALDKSNGKLLEIGGDFQASAKIDSVPVSASGHQTWDASIPRMMW